MNGKDKNNDSLKESEEKYRSLIDSSSDHIFMLNLRGTYIYSNNKIAQFGLKQGESLIGKHIRDVYVNFICDHYMEQFEKVITLEKPITFEHLMPQPDKVLYHLDTLFPLFREKSLISIGGICRDITEIKEVQEELKILSNAIDQSADIVFITDRGGNIQYVNPAFEHVTGYSRDEAIGKKPGLLNSGHMHPHFHQQLWRTVTGGEAFRSIVTNKKKNGELFQYDQTITPIIGKDGHITHFISTGKDITERIRMEDTVKLMDQAIEASINGIAITDLEMKIIHVNPSFVRMWGYESKKDILAEFDVEIWRDSNKKGEILESLHKEGKFTEDISAVKKDGTRFDVEISANMILNDKGEPIYMMASLVDITERKLAEKELNEKYLELKRTKEELALAYKNLQETQAKLIQSEKLAGMGTLAAGVAHEINNPLQVIIGYAEMIDATEPEQLQEDLNEILGATDRIQSIVKNLTSYSRDVTTTDLEPINLNEVIKKSIEMSRFNKNFRTLTLTTEYGEIPRIHGNQGEFQQVFINLIGNAADAMEGNGDLSIRTEFADSIVTIEVSDTGTGIPKENLGKIFDPFFTTKKVGKGTGLGLHVIRQIVIKYHGKINVESDLEKGTSFILKFPISGK